MKIRAVVLVVALLIMGSGCAGLLPSSKQMVKSPWDSYNMANAAYEKIIPGKTTTEDLKNLGIDPYTTPNILIVTFQDILTKYLPNASIKKEDLDTGIQECLNAKNTCFGYGIEPSFLQNKRVGNFFKDFTGFKKQAKETGWKFKGLILIVEKTVVYKERPGGNPVIEKDAESKKPLGPVQDGGEKLIDFGKNRLLD